MELYDSDVLSRRLPESLSHLRDTPLGRSRDVNAEIFGNGDDLEGHSFVKRGRLECFGNFA